MKVKELIAELQKLDSELEVWVETCCDFNRTESVKIHNENEIAIIDASWYLWPDRIKELSEATK